MTFIDNVTRLIEAKRERERECSCEWNRGTMQMLASGDWAWDVCTNTSGRLRFKWIARREGGAWA